MIFATQPANGRRFSSLIAAEERFAFPPREIKRPSAAMSEEKRLSFAGYLLPSYLLIRWKGLLKKAMKF